MRTNRPAMPTDPAPVFVRSYPEQSRSSTVFVLGLLGILVFPLLAPFAWFMGNRELSAIRAGRRPPENEGLARVGQVLGIIVSVFLLLFAALVFGLLGMAFFRL